VPPLQVPLDAKVRRVVLLTQTAAGGELQVTLAQGSALQLPPLQPKAQVVSVGA
jgi:hypothetical protein